ncbi:DOPA 4,5-dioxygenase family protein [Dyella sp. ASV21]|uniref:DOPA 4,5-dioxygenase family protein n=1 Tax=Dyella sp. ASV21 TaxID=2795114 RepID=UPI0018EB9395|nr:DOPA 4,5-dioxygenase family protein [Dyella sp. ASV21]
MTDRTDAPKNNHPLDTAPVNQAVDGEWANLLSPQRRQLIRDSGLAIGALAFAGLAAPTRATGSPQASGVADAGKNLAEPVHKPGESPWGYETYKQATPRPAGIRPGEKQLPARPRAYTDIKSYHAHIYFDEDSYEKAALIRRWAAERFAVELGDWNLEPRGPHTTPSFYFGFANALLPTVLPWLQLNSLGLTILIHPNTDDPRADHLYYALWVNRSQPVNAFDWPTREQRKDLSVEQIYPNTKPHVTLET